MYDCMIHPLVNKHGNGNDSFSNRKSRHAIILHKTLVWFWCHQIHGCGPWSASILTYIQPVCCSSQHWHNKDNKQVVIWGNYLLHFWIDQVVFRSWGLNNLLILGNVFSYCPFLFGVHHEDVIAVDGSNQRQYQQPATSSGIVMRNSVNLDNIRSRINHQESHIVPPLVCMLDPCLYYKLPPMCIGTKGVRDHLREIEYSISCEVRWFMFCRFV